MLPLLLSSALACGGMFCSSQAQPINQAGERIVFALDEAAGEVEMHAKIAYEGPADQFAWLVPVPAAPELFVSTDELFSFLNRNTAPIFALRQICSCCEAVNNDTVDSVDGAGDTDSPGGGPDPVVVVASSLVGPYASVVLQASDAGALIQWLNDNDYFVPDRVEPFLDPYAAGGSYVVALKLQKDRGVGDLVPLGLRFPGTAVTIPLVMTAVAATPDMPVIPWVLASGRAVPSNYLHVTINELAVDWWNGGSNYNELVSRAADEAGGQAFATDFAGSTQPFRDRLAWPGRYNETALRSETTLRGLWGAILSQGFVINDDLTGIVSAQFPESEAVLIDIGQGGDTGFFGGRDYACDEPEELGCATIDPTAVVDMLMAAIVTPNARANQLFSDMKYITRLTSSVSPVEMTVDPQFVVNQAQPDVAQVRAATIDIGGCYGEDLNRLTLADGTTVYIPEDQRPQEYLQGLVDLPVRTIEQMSAHAPPVLLTDHGPEIDALVSTLNGILPAVVPPEADEGCGCDAPNAHPAWALALLAAAARRRRRA